MVGREKPSSLAQAARKTMPCKHLKELFEMCQSHNLRLSSSDLIRIVCPQCGVEEACPSVLCEEYERKHPGEAEAQEPGG
jgi:hypothetical protein